MARNILYVGNRNPSLFATLVDGSGNVINLTNYAVQFGLRREYANANQFKGTASIVNGPAGTVRYDFGAADLVGVAPGLYWGQWVATDAGGKPENISAGGFEIRMAV